MVVVKGTKKGQLEALLEQCVQLNADVRPNIFHGDSSAALEYFGTAGGAGSTGTNQRMGGAVPQCGLLLL